MGIEPPSFLLELKKRNPEFGENILKNYSKVFSEGALSIKTKILITMALDAEKGLPVAVKQLSKQARKVGATNEEIQEVLELVTMVCGFQGLNTAVEAFE